MTLQRCIDSALVTLSVMTVLLSMVSFILHKMRQLDGINPKQGESGKKMESAFFKRFLPKGELPLAVPPASSCFAISTGKIYGFIILISAGLFLSLAIQNPMGPSNRSTASGETSKRLELRIKNTSSRPLENFSIEIDSDSKAQLDLPSPSAPSQARLETKDGKTLLHLRKIDSNQELKFRITSN